MEKLKKLDHIHNIIIYSNLLQDKGKTVTLRAAVN